MKQSLLHAHSENPGAVGFSPQQAALRIHSLAAEKLIFEIFVVIRFVLEGLLVHHDTLMYP